MYEIVKRLLLRLFRVPHDPVAPAGSPDSVRIFRASPRLFQWNLIQWGALQLAVGLPFALVVLTMMLRTAKLPEWFRLPAWIGLGSLAALFVAQLLITFWMQKLDYEMRWYIVTDRSLRIRAGVWSVKEITMTFANIQKVQVSQGPIQKILNMATVVVSSAGGGAVAGPHGHAAGSDRHAAQFQGVDNAQEIRDIILERLRRYRDAGLGDSPSLEGGDDGDDQHAAAAVLEAARELRLFLERPVIS
jgi:membrane protein YdbS with pleckstrin-like domain